MSAIKYPKNHDLRELISFTAETGHIWLAESRMLCSTSRRWPRCGMS